ncbi:MAG TPA: RagB/SusD family nutrient uptake outer membrane protein [Phnomibacter sp.]|nr:RagB/SusD family nutrient uptake outer membrane protein [Phnomibacter sp.]
MFTVNRKLTLMIVGLFTMITQQGCEKFLDAKPTINLAIPATLRDVEALLNNTSVFTMQYSLVGEGSADNYFIGNIEFQALSSQSGRNTYSWQGDVSVDENSWLALYKQVYTANVALEALASLKPQAADEAGIRKAKGTALFFRSRALHEIAVAFAPVFEASTATSKMGIPLRNTTDFTTPSERAGLAASYQQIVEDMKEAAQLLPLSTSHTMLPNRVAALAYLSRYYLSMGDFTAAGSYSDSVLLLRNELLNYNTINANADYPVPARNTEVLFEGLMQSTQQLTAQFARIDSNLYKSYAPNDLRKSIFFKTATNGYVFKGNYTGSSWWFGGVATDEMYLTAAECKIRAGEIQAGLSLLNKLLQTRWKQGTWQPITGLTASEALQTVLAERRKSLLMREIRWMDVKRLSVLETANRVTMKRFVNGKEIILPPGSNRYALPFPETVISMTGMQQNPE